MSLTIPFASLPPISREQLQRLEDAQSVLVTAEQTPLATEHVIHGGMYARTIRLAPGVIICGCLVKVPTMLIINGCADVLIGDEWAMVDGYGVVPASAGRKQVFISRSWVELTMIFATQAKTVDEAEREFTDEHELLVSRHNTNVVVITGE